MDELEQALHGIAARRRQAELEPEPVRSVLLAHLDRQESELHMLQEDRETEI
jgi:hypothetical protein